MRPDKQNLYGSGQRIARNAADGDWLGIARELCAPTIPDTARALKERGVTAHPHETPEATMDVRTPDLTREEAKVMAERRLNTLLADEVDALPGQGDSEAATRDLAMRIAIKAFSGSAYEDQRTILTALHALDRLYPYDPEEAEFWAQKAKDTAERRMNAAGRGAPGSVYMEWCMLHQIADEALDEAREQR